MKCMNDLKKLSTSMRSLYLVGQSIPLLSKMYEKYLSHESSAAFLSSHSSVFSSSSFRYLLFTWLFLCLIGLTLKAIADVEKAIIEALERQYADELAPLKDSMAPKKFGLKYVQKLTKRNSQCPYTVPDEVSFYLVVC